MKATKKLIGAFVALIAALAVSVGATFAWFTEQTTAKVNSFELTVQDATGNLYIGKDQNALGQSPIDLSSEASAVTLKDVTTTEDTNKGKEFKKKGGEDPAEVNSYLKVELWFKSDTNLGLYLYTGTTMTSTNQDDTNDLIISDTSLHETIETKYTGTITDGKIVTTAQNAARVSFFAEGDEGAAKIWEPHPSDGYSTGNLAADYEAYLKDTSKWPDPAAEASKITGDLTIATTTEAGAGGATKITDLVAGVAKKVTICIWLEGTDGDCLNSIFKDVLKTELVFAGIAAA